METETLTEADVQRAEAIWAEYQKTHDVSGLKGEAVGVDPHTGEVYFGRSSSVIQGTLRADGRWRPLVYWRVGFPYYRREGGPRRWSPDR